MVQAPAGDDLTDQAMTTAWQLPHLQQLLSLPQDMEGAAAIAQLGAVTWKLPLREQMPPDSTKVSAE